MPDRLEELKEDATRDFDLDARWNPTIVALIDEVKRLCEIIRDAHTALDRAGVPPLDSPEVLVPRIEELVAKVERAGVGYLPKDDDERDALGSEIPGCEASRKYLCTRKLNHGGDHVAATIDGRIIERWPG